MKSVVTKVAEELHGRIMDCLVSIRNLKAKPLKIGQIRCFVAVVQGGSLSAAAKEQFVTVQAVSKTIANFERELGRDLFVRKNFGIIPTPFAVGLYDRAERVLSGFDNLQEFVEHHAQLNEPLVQLRLALNTPPFMGNETVRENSASVVGAALGMDCTMELATGERGFEGLCSGEFDAIVTVGTFTHPDTECKVLGTVPAAILMAENHPLAASNVVKLSDLTAYPVARSSWFFQANDTIVSMYLKRGVALRLADVSMEDIGDHFAGGGVLFTTGIPALERMHPGMTLRMMTAEDAVAVPICVVFLKERHEAVAKVVEKLLDAELPYFLPNRPASA